jgi:hypothetical protein
MAAVDVATDAANRFFKRLRRDDTSSLCTTRATFALIGLDKALTVVVASKHAYKTNKECCAMVYLRLAFDCGVLKSACDVFFSRVEQICQCVSRQISDLVR